ncbi:MAG: hypothetical protein HRU41_06620 [Saprospiraceae bacterium]|nr:hypothetical protein [Saprospiraceae bacterium]
MKFKLFTLIFALLTLPFLGHTQIAEQSRSMSLGTHNALVLELPQNDQKLVSKVWEGYMKSFYDTKSKHNRKTGEWVAEEADIVSLGKGDDVDLFTTIEQRGKNVELALWVHLQEEDTYVTSERHPDRSVEAEKLLMRFGLEVARETIKLELKSEEKKLNQMGHSMKKLKNAKDRYRKDIEKAQAAIRKAEENILKNEGEQEDMMKQMEVQREVIEMVQKKLRDL